MAAVQRPRSRVGVVVLLVGVGVLCTPAPPQLGAALVAVAVVLVVGGGPARA